MKIEEILAETVAIQSQLGDLKVKCDDIDGELSKAEYKRVGLPKVERLKIKPPTDPKEFERNRIKEALREMNRRAKEQKEKEMTM